MAADKLLEGRLNQFNGIGLGLGENLRVFDVFARDSLEFPGVGGRPAPQRLQGAFADVDSPHIRHASHGRFQKIGGALAGIWKGTKRFSTNTL